MTKPSAFLTLKAAADLTGIDTHALYRMVRDGHLPHATLPIGTRKRIFVPRAAIDQLIADMDADAAHSVKPIHIGTKQRRRRGA